MGRVISWIDFAARRKSTGISVSTHGRCLGKSKMANKKTQELGTYSEGVGRILECSRTKNSGDMSNLKVYSRRSQRGVQILSGGAIRGSRRCLDDFGDMHKTVDLSSCSSQSLSDFSADYSDLDGELEIKADVTNEHIREDLEEASLEGVRCLLGSQDLPSEGKNNNEVELRERLMELECSVKSQDKQGELSKDVLDRKESEQNFSDGQRAQRSKVLRTNFQKLASKKSRTGMQVAKMEVSWKEIKEAIGTLNIELIEEEVGNKSDVV